MHMKLCNQLFNSLIPWCQHFVIGRVMCQSCAFHNYVLHRSRFSDLVHVMLLSIKMIFTARSWSWWWLILPLSMYVVYFQIWLQIYIDGDVEGEHVQCMAGKILGANIHRWANFLYFFQNKYSPISIFSKTCLSMKSFYIKNHQDHI